MVRQAPLWRAIAVFRVATLAYAALLVALNAGGYAHPAGGWSLLAAMTAWTGLTAWWYARPRRRAWPVLAVDLAVAVTVLVASGWVIGEPGNQATLPALWVAAPVLAWAVQGGWRAGVVAALVVAGADVSARTGWSGTVAPNLVNASVLLVLAGFTVGYFARLARDAERRLQEAARREAANRERERLARGIHDSVLQVLALVQRRGAELGGEAAVLGRLAGEQENTLRALVAGDRGAGSGSEVDLRGLLARCAGGRVTVSAPGEPVPLPEAVATELAAAVGSALDNVREHAGPAARAWVLVEAEPGAVTVTVRDDGVGMTTDRLARAAGEGRLGVAQSIEGRMRDLGGGASIVSAPGEGTEVELRLPWRV